MREEFRAELAEVSGLLVAHGRRGARRDEARHVTSALLNADAGVAEGVIAGRHGREPAAQGGRGEGLRAAGPAGTRSRSDLRPGRHRAAHRLTTLSAHGRPRPSTSRQIALRRHPARRCRTERQPMTIGEMADVADRIAGKISKVLAEPRRRAGGGELEATTTTPWTRLHKGLSRGVARRRPGSTASSRPSTAHAARPCSTRRYADHAVNAGHHMYFFVTGEALVLAPRAHDRRPCARGSEIYDSRANSPKDHGSSGRRGATGLGAPPKRRSRWARRARAGVPEMTAVVKSGHSVSRNHHLGVRADCQIR